MSLRNRGSHAIGVSSSSDDSSDAETWIEWFCRQEGNEFFCEVDRRYIQDNFNLYGLREKIPNFKMCLEIILDKADIDQFDVDNVALDKNVQDLYGLIHARFILTKRGQDRMLRKFRDLHFGICPLLGCEATPVLPVGLHDSLDQSPAMVYCPRCRQVMLASHRTSPQGYDHDVELDGAYFGTTFPHLFLMQYPTLVPEPPNQVARYVPRVFGFRVRDVRSKNKSRSKKKDTSSSSASGKNANSK